MFGNVVLGIDKDRFEHELSAVKKKAGVKADVDLTEKALADVIERYKGVVQKETGQAFPQEPREQLKGARDAVFRSWMNPRAVTYRKLNDIPHDLGTAVNVQSMVFGNMGDTSATGVGFTRNPSTGAKEFYGEFLQNAQGEDVVAGIRTPQPITELEKVMPEAYRQLREITTRLERHYKDVQDFEFTIQDNTLYMLQTRNGKRTGVAAVHIAVDLVEEGILTPKEAVGNVEPQSLDQLLHPIFDPKERASAEIAANGLPASPGAATGAIVFTADDAVAWTAKGKRVVLVRMETVPDDIHGMSVAQGILTATGGMTSHAAVVGRQMGKPSVVGCGALEIDVKARRLKIGKKTLKEGDPISIDGSTGDVILRELPTTPSEVLQVVAGTLKPAKRLYQKFEKLLGWADEVRRLGVRANADIPRDAKVAFAFGARGIGLCRTEHMFFAEDRLPHVVKMILSAARGQKGLDLTRRLKEKLAEAKGEQAAILKELAGSRRSTASPSPTTRALAKLLPMQRADFAGLFKEMHGNPVTIRTLDPPLHEFLPKREELMVEVALPEAKGGGARRRFDRAAPRCCARSRSSTSSTPCSATAAAASASPTPRSPRCRRARSSRPRCQVAKKGTPVKPEVMIPLVGHVEELRRQKQIVLEAATEVLGKNGSGVEYLVGTMIEVPRGAVTADEIAKEAEFFSFGTNDLTQMGFGLSRDDAGKFLGRYIEHGILDKDPFVSIDAGGVGQLVEIGVRKGRKVKPEAEDRRLRRARRRSRVHPVLPQGGPRLRLLLALPGAHRPARRGAGRAREARPSEIPATSRRRCIPVASLLLVAYHRLRPRRALRSGRLGAEHCTHLADGALVAHLLPVRRRAGGTARDVHARAVRGTPEGDALDRPRGPDGGGGTDPRGSVPLPPARHRGLPQGRQPSQGRRLRRVHLLHRARHPLRRAERPVRDPRAGPLPGPQLPRHAPRGAHALDPELHGAVRAGPQLHPAARGRLPGPPDPGHALRALLPEPRRARGPHRGGAGRRSSTSPGPRPCRPSSGCART